MKIYGYLIMMLTSIIIDDDADATHTINDVLSANNIKVLAIGFDGKEAVKLYHHLRPDITILDIMMPDFDGIYAYTEIKRINPNAKIIFITASHMIDERLERSGLVPSAILLKPFDVKQLLLTIAKIQNE